MSDFALVIRRITYRRSIRPPPDAQFSLNCLCVFGIMVPLKVFRARCAFIVDPKSTKAYPALALQQIVSNGVPMDKRKTYPVTLSRITLTMTVSFKLNHNCRRYCSSIQGSSSPILKKNNKRGSCY